MMSLKEGILCINTEIFNFNFFNIELLWTISTTIHKCIASAFSIHWDILHLSANDSNCLYGKVPLREHLNAFVTISNSSVAAGNVEKEPEPCEQAAAVGNQSHVLHGCSLRTHVLEQEARSQLQPMFKKKWKMPAELCLLSWCWEEGEWEGWSHEKLYYWFSLLLSCATSGALKL